MEYSRILLTGAAGRLGSYLRKPLSMRWPLRSVDRKTIANSSANDENRTFDLTDPAAVAEAMQGCDAVVHFASSIPLESESRRGIDANIAGLLNLYEAARACAVRRVIYASSNHAVGFHPRDASLDADSPPRPDSLYGVGKVFGETLGRFYWDRYGIEHASIRIGAAKSEPDDRRNLATWLSYPDLLRLVLACLEAERLGFAVVYGISANQRAPRWDNSGVSQVRYLPQDDSERFAPAILAQPEWDAEDPRNRLVGGLVTTLAST